MKKSNFKKVFVVVAVIAITGFGVNAFADWGMGSGHQGMMGYQDMGNAKTPGYHHGYNCQEGKFLNLSEEEIQKLRAARESFFSDTEDLRRNIYSKQLELKSELVKKELDTKKAASIQNEISELQAKFAQKRLAHQIEMRELCPNAGQGFMMGGSHMGYGGGGSCGR